MLIELGKKYSYEYLMKMFDGEKNMSGVDSVEISLKLDEQKYILFFEPEHVYIDKDTFDIINSQCYILRSITKMYDNKKEELKMNDVKTYNFRNGLISDLFSEKIGWEEWESIKINGIGFLLYQIEDNAGSVTVFISQRKLDEPCYDEDVKLLKLCFLGSYGNPDGIGIFYYNHNRKTGLYTKNKKFNNFKEGDQILEKHLRKLIV